MEHRMQINLKILSLLSPKYRFFFIQIEHQPARSTSFLHFQLFLLLKTFFTLAALRFESKLKVFSVELIRGKKCRN